MRQRRDCSRRAEATDPQLLGAPDARAGAVQPRRARRAGATPTRCSSRSGPDQALTCAACASIAPAEQPSRASSRCSAARRPGDAARGRSSPGSASCGAPASPSRGRCRPAPRRVAAARPIRSTANATGSPRRATRRPCALPAAVPTRHPPPSPATAASHPRAAAPSCRRHHTAYRLHESRLQSACPDRTRTPRR